jgi:hypothetical protein
LIPLNEKMQSLLLHVDAATVFLARDGTIGGKVCFQMGSLFFPDLEWVDFPVQLLTSWLGGELSLVEGRQAEVTNEFLDGPFRAILSVSSPSEWVVTLVEDCLHGWRQIARDAFDPMQFLRTLLASSEAILKTCAENGWTSQHIDALRKEYEAWHRLGYCLKQFSA